MKTNAMETENVPAVGVPRMVRHLRVRIRELADGRYIAEERCGWWMFSSWQAIDCRTPQFLWSPGDAFYSHCIGDYEQVLKGIAERGHSLPNATVEVRQK